MVVTSWRSSSAAGAALVRLRMDASNVAAAAVLKNCIVNRDNG